MLIDMHACFKQVIRELVRECRTFYGEDLVSLVIFSSVGRGTARRDSDIDFLIVARNLPDGRGPRVRQFDAVESLVKPALRAARDHGCHIELSPLFKTPAEVQNGSLIFLDMI